MERMAPAQPPDRQPTASSGTVDLDRFKRVRAARGVKTTTRHEQRADELPVTRNQSYQQPRSQ